MHFIGGPLGPITGLIHFIGNFCTLTIRPIKKLCLKITDYQGVTKDGSLVALFPCFDHRAGAILSLRACKGYFVRYGGKIRQMGPMGWGYVYGKRRGRYTPQKKRQKIRANRSKRYPPIKSEIGFLCASAASYVYIAFYL